jgi:hypothetical protein
MGGAVSAMKIIESLEIPLYSDTLSRWEVKVDLSGKRYSFYVSYNSRMEAWFMSVSDANGKPLLAGIRLVPGVYFLDKYRASVPELPPGELWLMDTEGKQETAEVTRENLNIRFALTYTIFEE